ncbi:MAG: MFS transporter, partial [Actinomycetota bacterium]|nr:MFS transporter [Actinomycetota bacterium]
TAANGLLAARANVARLVGAWLGGTLLAVGGIPLVYAVYAAILVVGAAAMCGRFPVSRPAKAVKPPPLRVDRSLLPIGIALTLMCVAQGIFLVRFVPFVLETLGAGSGGVGLLRGVQAVGGLAAGFAVATVAKRVAPTRLFAWGAVAFGLVSACIWHGPALTTAIGVYVGMFVAVGAPGVVANSGLAALLQSAVPPAATGRLLAAAFALMTLGTTAGMLVAGAVESPVLLDVQAFLHVAAGGVLLVHQHFAAGHAATTRGR